MTAQYDQVNHVPWNELPYLRLLHWRRFRYQQTTFTGCPGSSPSFHCHPQYKWLRVFLSERPYLIASKASDEMYSVGGIDNSAFLQKYTFVPVDCSLKTLVGGAGSANFLHWTNDASAYQSTKFNWLQLHRYCWLDRDRYSRYRPSDMSPIRRIWVVCFFERVLLSRLNYCMNKRAEIVINISRHEWNSVVSFVSEKIIAHVAHL